MFRYGWEMPEKALRREIAVSTSEYFRPLSWDEFATAGMRNLPTERLVIRHNGDVEYQVRGELTGRLGLRVLGALRDVATFEQMDEWFGGDETNELTQEDMEEFFLWTQEVGDTEGHLPEDDESDCEDDFSELEYLIDRFENHEDSSREEREARNYVYHRYGQYLDDDYEDALEQLQSDVPEEDWDRLTHEPRGFRRAMDFHVRWRTDQDCAMTASWKLSRPAVRRQYQVHSRAGRPSEG